MLIIGEERGRDGGRIYAGPWKGKKTPYLFEIKKEDYALFSRIVSYYEKEFEGPRREELIEEKYENPFKRICVTYTSSRFCEIPRDWGSEEIQDYIKRTTPKGYSVLSYSIEED